MTDKQIIIDGVDVSECSFFDIHYSEDEDVEIKNFCRIVHYNCDSYPNCYYKQIKAKEQECERLNDIIETKLEDANICDSALNYINDEYLYVKRKLDQLKSDNKHLNDLLNQALKELEEMRELKDTESLQACILTRENERLKELLAQDQCFQDRSHKCVKSFYIDERYKQAIEKVRELIQKEIADCEHCDDCTNCEYNCCLKQAKQICDEVNE